MNTIKKYISIPKWLFVLLLVVLILRIPSLFEPYSYGDEMIYLTLGEGIRQGLTLYKDIHDNKPPLLYFTAAIAGSLFWFKAILALWHLITVFLFWKLTQHFFDKHPKARMISTILFAVFTTIPLFEGNIANAELFMVGFTILSFMLVLHKNSTFGKIFGAGVLLSFAGLYKIPALFDCFAVGLLWAYQIKNLDLKNILAVGKKTMIYAIGIATPFVLLILWYSSKGALTEFVGAALMQNVGYLSSWRPDDVQKPFLERNGPLLVRFLILLLGLLVLFIKRSKLSMTFVFASSWLLASVFAATLSERPYPHYMIQVVPPATILIAIFITNKTKEQVYALIPLLIAVMAPFYYKFWYYPSVPYYNSFIKYISSTYSTEEYFDTFNKNINKNYEIARYVLKYTSNSDRIFVWEDSPTLYALTKRIPPIRFVAGYHINEFSDKEVILDQIITAKPKIIITMSEAGDFPGLEYLLRKDYALTAEIENAKIWRHIGK